MFAFMRTDKELGVMVVPSRVASLWGLGYRGGSFSPCVFVIVSPCVLGWWGVLSCRRGLLAGEELLPEAAPAPAAAAAPALVPSPDIVAAVESMGFSNNAGQRAVRTPPSKPTSLLVAQWPIRW